MLAPIVARIADDGRHEVLQSIPAARGCEYGRDVIARP
jgi:hypothetical protein